MNKVLKDIKKYCQECPAWSGVDCTRNPYTEGCLKDVVVCPVCGKVMNETYMSTQLCYDCEKKIKE